MGKKQRYTAILIVSLLAILGHPVVGAVSIPTDTLAGTWNPGTRTYTLNQDLSEPIEIVQDNVVLDGVGHTVAGSGSGYGVDIEWRTGVTVKNLTVRGFIYGIYVSYSSGNSLTGNTVSSNTSFGILIHRSNNNTITGNTISSNTEGMHLIHSGGNHLSGNVMSGNLPSNFSVRGEDDAAFDNDIDTTNTVEGKPIYYIRNAVGQVYDSSTNAGVLYAINCINITVKDLTLTDNLALCFWKTNDSTIQNMQGSPDVWNMDLHLSNGNTLTGITNARDEVLTVSLDRSDNNKVTGNKCNRNSHFSLISCSGNAVEDNTFSDVVIRDSHDNTITRNTMSRYGMPGGIGINLLTSNDNVITDNTTDDGQNGIRLECSSGNTISGNIVSGNLHGIVISDFAGPTDPPYTTNNNVTGNTVEGNFYNGIWVGGGSSNNTVARNTVRSNGCGIICWPASENNQIYHNKFIDNTTQAKDEGGSGNVFNLAKPTGGNYWSDWTTPDADHDGFVDVPYVFSGNRDNLPWADPDGWENRRRPPTRVPIEPWKRPGRMGRS